MALHDQPMFSDNIEHWTYGPAIYEIWKRFQGESTVISDDETVTEVLPHSFSLQQRQIIENIFRLHLHKTGVSLIHETHKQKPYTQTAENAVMSHTLLKESFRELESQVPYMIVSFMQATSDDEFEECLLDARKFLSYGYLDSCSLDSVLDSFKSSEKELQQALIRWTSCKKVGWPEQTLFDTFMGHLFFPLQYDYLFESTGVLNDRNYLSCLISTSAAFGNVLALYHAACIANSYSLEEDDDDVLKCLDTKKRSTINACAESDELTHYYKGLLCMSLGNYRSKLNL